MTKEPAFPYEQMSYPITVTNSRYVPVIALMDKMYQSEKYFL